MPVPLRLGTPEKKILIAFCYYVLVGVIALSELIQNFRHNEVIAREVGMYFICESGGIDPDDPEECDRSEFDQYRSPELVTCSFALAGIFPAVNLIFAVNIKQCKQSFIKCYMYLKTHH